MKEVEGKDEVKKSLTQKPEEFEHFLVDPFIDHALDVVEELSLELNKRRSEPFAHVVAELSRELNKRRSESTRSLAHKREGDRNSP